LAYRIQFTRDGLKDAKALPRNVKNSLARELKAILARNPTSSSEALREPLAAWRSFHSGKYRVVFKLFDDLRIIAVAGIGKHSSHALQDIYKRLEELAKTGRLAEKIVAALRGFSESEK
jgi:mRNA-degrading endonuclease RelE of RelBE toxin-antitoxin system